MSTIIVDILLAFGCSMRNVDIIEAETRMRYIPFYVWFMIALTGLYLTVEVPFAAYLLRIFSGQSSPADIQPVDEFGRLLTGVAVFIAILGYMVPRFVYNGTSPVRIIVTSVITLCVTVFMTFHALHMYGTLSAELASDKDLRSAYVGMLARRVMAENGAGDLRPAEDDAAWRAFVATAASTSDIPTLLNTIGTDTRKLVSEETVRTVGTQAMMRERFFGGAFDKVRQSYNDYADGSEAYTKAMRNIDRDGNREFDKYIADLRQRYPEGIPRRGWTTAGIRKEVRKRLPVSLEWDIVDRHGWNVAYRQVAVKEIKKQYLDKMISVLGRDGFVEPGLSFDAFLADKDVQKLVRENVRRQLGIDVGGAMISERMSDAAFDASIYRPYLTAVATNLSSIATQSEEPLYGNQLEMARKAYQAATLPGTALLLSLAGAALHVFKFASYVAQAYGFYRGRNNLSYGRRKFVAGGAVLLCGVATMIFVGDSVTTTQTFSKISANTPYTAVMSNAVSIQPAFDAFSSVLSTTGIWAAVSTNLPQPKPYLISVSQEITASTAPDAEVTPMRASTVSTDGLVIPTPIPRPASL